MKRRGLFILGLAACIIVIVLLGPTLKRHAEAVNCSNQMSSILLVATMEWPREHEGFLPTNFISMSNGVMVPTLLICPGDHTRSPAMSWAMATAANCSYEIVTPGLKQGETNGAFMRCKIHGFLGYADDRLVDAEGHSIAPKRVW